MKRRMFSQKELSVAAATGFIRAIDRHQRPHIVTYPVDDHEPLRPTDRDDGIAAEEIEGGYLLHVTIADVAAHIPKNHILDVAAQKRAFTIYRPPARDPMFPFVLSEDRFSLEHEQERLGMTATIKLDKHFRKQAFWLTPTLVESQCQDYATASHRMIQEGDDFELLARIAKGIRDNHRPEIKAYDAGDSAFMDKSGLLRQGDAGKMAAAKLVQILMIYANNQISDFFDGTGVPFLYRNHDEKKIVNGQLPFAEYEPRHKGHYGLRTSDGLQGAYGHNTSPIRRYADLVNQRVQHYAVDVMKAIAEELTEHLPEGDSRQRDDLLPLVWKNGKAIITAVQDVHDAQDIARPLAQMELKKELALLLREVNPTSQNLYQHGDPLTLLSSVALRQKPPYTYNELLAIVPSLNEQGTEENEAIRELNTRNLKKWEERVQVDFDAGHFDQLEGTAFSTLLRRAAVTGKMNEDFAREAVERIKTGRINKSVDCFSALILSKEYQDKNWRAIKRAALNAIERDPMTTNNIYDNAIRDGEVHRDTFIAEAQMYDNASDKSLPLLKGDGVKAAIDAALVVTYMDGLGDRMFTASSYSLGYNKKDTLRHAKFNFIRALSFGELGPFDQTILPMPLYAELNHNRNRFELLKEIAENTGLTLQTIGPRQQVDGRIGYAIKVTGPGLERQIVGFVIAPTLHEAQEKASTRILRSIAFKRAYEAQRPKSIVVDFPDHPEVVIRTLAEERSWKLDVTDRKDIIEIDRGVFRATVRLELAPEDVIEVIAEGGNKTSALLHGFETIRERLQERGILETPKVNDERRWETWARGMVQQGAYQDNNNQQRNSGHIR